MASSERGLSGDDFVARAHELSIISASAEAAKARRPGVVWVEGEAGSGKTALVRQAVKALPPGFSVLKGQADELATDIAYELADQLGVVNCEGPFVAGMSLLEAWARAQDDGPVVIVVEDLRWADLSSSQALLSGVKRLERDRVLVVITSRPTVGEGWERFVLVIGAVILLLVPVIPFTEQYAKQSVPREEWGTPTFKRVNHGLSVAWGASIVVIGVARVLAEAVARHSSGHHLAQILLGAAVPAIIIVYMLKFTQSYPERVAHAPA